MKKSFLYRHLITLITIGVILSPLILYLLMFMFFEGAAMLCDPHCIAEKDINHAIPKSFRLDSYKDICEGFACDAETTTEFGIPPDGYQPFVDDLIKTGWKNGTLADVKQYLSNEFLSQRQLSEAEPVIFRYIPTFFQGDPHFISSYVVSFVLNARKEFVVYKSSF